MRLHFASPGRRLSSNSDSNERRRTDSDRPQADLEALMGLLLRTVLRTSLRKQI